MDTGTGTISRFYTSLKQLNPEGMNSCYGEDIIFSDPVFGVLRGEEVRAMWEMLCHRARNYSFSFSPPEDKGDGYYTCNWKATYLFSKTGKLITNKGKAFMKLEDGLIIEHSDAFSLRRWIHQAFGLKGYLFGGFGFFQKRIRLEAQRSLEKWMSGKRKG